MGPSLGFWSIALCRTPEAAISQSTEDTRHILSGESNGSHYLRHHKAAMLRPWCIEAVTPGQLQTIGNLFWNRSNNSMWPPRNHRRVTSRLPGHLVTFANKKKATSFEAAQDEGPALIDFPSQAIKKQMTSISRLLQQQLQDLHCSSIFPIDAMALADEAVFTTANGLSWFL